MTDAERTLESFNTATKTVSLVTLAKRAKARSLDIIVPKIRMYCFPDGSALHVMGRGMAHKVEIHNGPASSSTTTVS